MGAIHLAGPGARLESETGVTFRTGPRAEDVRLVLDVTETGEVMAATLDVFVDVSIDGSTWVNAAHFPQVTAGDDPIVLEARLAPDDAPTAVVNVTSDAAAGVVRPALFGPMIRARWAIVDAEAPGFTFAVTAFAA